MLHYKHLYYKMNVKCNIKFGKLNIKEKFFVASTLDKNLYLQRRKYDND